jgi:hypothetical protein
MLSEQTARNKANRRAGARWQAALRDGFRRLGFDVEELKLAGREDEGDLVLRLKDRFLVIEAKAGVMKAAEFVIEAARERRHFAAHRGLPGSQVGSIAVVKRRGKGWQDAYVLTTVEDYFALTDREGVEQ